MENWLKNRLSPVKIDTDRWAELGEAIETYWRENFDADLAWIVSLRSIYETDLKGQRLIQVEKGEYFEDGIPDENIPLAVQQKELELCQKGSLIPFGNTLKRLGLTADWIPLHASRVKAYGTDFKPDGNVPVGYRLDGTWQVSDDGNAVLRAGYFLTSRGLLKVELSDDSVSNEIALIRNRLSQTRPVWIVFDGIIYHVGNEIIQDHNLETCGAITAETKLSGWNCGLKLDGTWGLGRVIRVDGQWCLNRGWKVGQIWPRGIIVNKLNGSRALDGTWQLDMVLLPHHKILDCRLETEGLIRIDADTPSFHSNHYFQVATDSPVPLDGDYQLGRVFAQWPDVTTNAVSSFDRDVYFGGESGALPLDIVYAGPLPRIWYVGGSAGLLPTNIVYGGDVDGLPSTMILGGDYDPDPQSIIYTELWRRIVLGGNAAELPVDILFGGRACERPMDVIDFGPIPSTRYFGGQVLDLPRHILYGGDIGAMPTTILISDLHA